MLRLRTPRAHEATMLTELCLRSKALWGYDNEFMQACRDELTLTASMMRSSSCFKVAEIDGTVIGVAQVTAVARRCDSNEQGEPKSACRVVAASFREESFLWRRFNGSWREDGAGVFGKCGNR